jgi:hypothetical protein
MVTTRGIESSRQNIAGAPRLPVIDTYGGGVPGVTAPAGFDNYSAVTFVHAGPDLLSPARLGVIGTFAAPYEPVASRQCSGQASPHASGRRVMSYQKSAICIEPSIGWD